MKKIGIYLTLGLLILFSDLSAQYAEAPNALSIRATATNFQFPLSSNNFEVSDYTFGGEISYIRHLHQYLNLAFPLKFAKADLPITETTVNEGEWIGSLDALVQLKMMEPDQLLYPYVFLGVGGMMEPNNLNVEFPLGIGLNLRVAHHVYVNIQSQFRIDLSDNRNQLQHGLGLLYILNDGANKKPPIVDTDLDGVPDNEDQCPTETGLPALQGCPDKDGDGLADHVDPCPEIAGPANGCPDSDGDGIADKDDACPNEAGSTALGGCPDSDGDGFGDGQDECPEIAGSLNGCPDRDGDGVKDSADNCPDEIGPIALAGCPDSDGDGIADAVDKCPNTPGIGTTTGCPEIKQEDQAILEFAMQEVQFETGKATLKSASSAVLNQVAEILNKYPDYKCKISGHTDSIGDAVSNQQLSEDRARACYNYLANNGISQSRLSFVGYGETRPIATNKYKDGREKNRRVEFDIYID